MRKNVAGQRIRVFAFVRTTAAPATGDAANITCTLSKDGGAVVALADTNPTEIQDGYYYFNVTKAESNADTLDWYPASSTSGVQVIAVGEPRNAMFEPGGGGPSMLVYEQGAVISKTFKSVGGILDLSDPDVEIRVFRNAAFVGNATIITQSPTSLEYTYTLDDTWNVGDSGEILYFDETGVYREGRAEFVVSDAVSVVVAPLSGITAAAAEGATIPVARGSTETVTIAARDRNGAEVDLSILGDLYIVVEDKDTEDVIVIPTEDITIDETNFTFTFTTPMTLTARNLRGALRKVSDEKVVMSLKIPVSYYPTSD